MSPQELHKLIKAASQALKTGDRAKAEALSRQIPANQRAMVMRVLADMTRKA